MKTAAYYGFMSVALLCTGVFSHAQVVPDTYWGGGVTSTKATYQTDVIGLLSTFDLTGTVVTQSGSDLTVKIYGNYFDDLMNRSSALLGTTLGDLFISTDGLSWTEGGAATLGDQFGTGTTWEYAVSLGLYNNANNQLVPYNEGNQLGADIYAITDPGTQIELSSINFNGIYRANQEVRVQNAGAAVGGAGWFISDDRTFLSITIEDFTGLFGLVGNLGFHWTMSCGNDVVEFAYNYNLTGPTPAIPEPATVGLLGVCGLAGLLVLRRRWARKVA